ncbi:MAG: hypothetical protein QOH17_4633 [Pseudonocardiales bacterium]|nr:hypothetical protein [Pseudonocardiales bacterium]
MVVELGDTQPTPVGGGRKQAFRAIAVVVVLVLGAVGLAVGDALSVPGTDSVSAKLAEWGRDHGLGGVVTWIEQVSYAANQPPVGGTPPGGIPTAAGGVPATGRSPGKPLAPVAGGPALPGEGQWQTVVTAHGRPAVEVAALRPDGQHTSFVVGVLRMDPKLVRGTLHPGTRDPGGTWKASFGLTPVEQRTVAVAFNGGFRLTDPSHNGYFSEGRTVTPLRDDAASLVLRTDGTADVGSWNREVRMGPTIASVRQNLQMLVDAGQVNPTCATGGTKEWGSTVGQAAYIHRSGFGVTADGTEVYVGGPALSVCTLGRILADAGVVRGMELDINPNWVTGVYFHAHPTGPPTGFTLFPAEKTTAAHYFSPSSRDWYAWLLR